MRIGWTVLTWLTLVGNAAAEEAKCPKGKAPIQLEDIEAAPGCIEAHKLHDACAWGSSGDANMTEIVMSKCEAGFLDHMTAAQKRRYVARGRACGELIRSRRLAGQFKYTCPPCVTKTSR